MPTLEDAAADLVDKLKTLEGRTEQADKGFADLEAKLASVSEQLESESNALSENVGSFIQHVRDVKSRLEQDSQESAAALGASDDAAEEARSEQQSEVQQTRSEIAVLQQHVATMEGQVSTIVGSVLAAASSLKTQADEAESRLEQVMAEAGRLVQEGLIADLEGFQQEIKQQADELRTTINDTCTQALQGAYENFAAKLDEVEMKVDDEAFDIAPEHARQVVEAALKECAEEYREELAQVVTAAATLESAIQELDREVDEIKSDTFEAGREDLLEKMGDTNDGLSEMQHALSEVKALLARFSFVRM